MTSYDEVLQVFRSQPGQLLTTRDVVEALGLDPKDEKACNSLSQTLTRLVKAHRLRRPGGKKGVYLLSDRATYVEAVRIMRANPLLFHDLNFQADAGAVARSESVAGSSTRAFLDSPPHRKGQAAGNKEQWVYRLGHGRTLTFHRHGNGVEAMFGLTDRPFSLCEFLAAVDWLEAGTGIPAQDWVGTKLGLHKDAVQLTLVGVGEVRITLGDLKAEVLRVYQHGCHGTRVEYHGGPHLALPEVIALLSGEGHVTCLGRLERLEAAIRQLASTVQHEVGRQHRRQGEEVQ